MRQSWKERGLPYDVTKARGQQHLSDVAGGWRIAFKVARIERDRLLALKAAKLERDRAELMKKVSEIQSKNQPTLEAAPDGPTDPDATD